MFTASSCYSGHALLSSPRLTRKIGSKYEKEKRMPIQNVETHPVDVKAQVPDTTSWIASMITPINTFLGLHVVKKQTRRVCTNQYKNTVRLINFSLQISFESTTLVEHLVNEIKRANDGVIPFPYMDSPR